MERKQIDPDGFELDFQQINSRPIEYYDDTIGSLVTQNIYQIAKRGDIRKVSIVKSSERRGNEIIRTLMTEQDIQQVLWGIPQELTFGLSQTRDEFKKEVEIWNSEFIQSKLFIVDNQALPIYSRGNIIYKDENVNSAVMGKLIQVFESFLSRGFIGEKPFGIFFGIPESFVYVFDEDLNISITFETFKHLKSIKYLNKIYKAAANVFIGKQSEEFQVCNAIFNLIKKNPDVDTSKTSFIIFNEELEVNYSNLEDFEISCLKKLLQTFPRIRKELEIEISDCVIGGNENKYGLGFTDKGIIAIKNDISLLPLMKHQLYNDILPIQV